MCFGTSRVVEFVGARGHPAAFAPLSGVGDIDEVAPHQSTSSPVVVSANTAGSYASTSTKSLAGEGSGVGPSVRETSSIRQSLRSQTSSTQWVRHSV